MVQPAPSTTSILLLHSRCRDEEEEEEAVPLSSIDYDYDDDGRLSSSPISCDILILPEIPFDDSLINMTHQGRQAMELFQNPFHPCGISNVLLLEHLPWKSVLLSLTSCSVSVHNSSLLLPVEPIPSTFDFSFGGTSRVAELTVDFDFASARSLLLQDDESFLLQTQEPMFQASASRETLDFIVSTDDQDVSKSPLASEASDDDPVGGSNGPPKAPNPSTFTSRAPPFQKRPHKSSQQRAQGHRDALLQLQAMMEKEARDLDFIITIVAAVGFFLFVLLCWSGYQLYQSGNKDDKRTQETRETILRKVLLLNAGKNDESHPTVSSKPNKVSSQINDDDGTGMAPTGNRSPLSVQVTPSRMQTPHVTLLSEQSPIIPDGPSYSRETEVSSQMNDGDGTGMAPTGNLSPLPVQVTPSRKQTPRLQAKRQALRVSENNMRTQLKNAQTVFCSQATPQRGNLSGKAASGDSEQDVTTSSVLVKPKSKFLTLRASRQNAAKKMDSIKADLSLRFRQQSGGAVFCPIHPTHDGDSVKITSSPDMVAEIPKAQSKNRSDDTAELSPCSKLAQEWAQRKSDRRNNRRKKRNEPKLQPFPIEPPSSDDDPTKTKEYLVPSSNTTLPILGPPTVVSTAIGNDFETQLLARRRALLREPPANGQARSDPPEPMPRNLDLPKLPDDCQDSSEVEIHQKSQQKELIRSSESPVYTSSGLPELTCSTPGSEDDSFIDDYWQMG